MSTAPANLPRFLPTLTEVVHLAALDGPATPAMPDIQATIGNVMQRVDLVLERRLSEEVDTMLRVVMTEQLQRLTAGLRQELELVVYQAVSEAMASWLDQHQSK